MTMGWSEGDVTSGDGLRLHYYRTGTGPTLILAHGVSDNGMCWRRVADALADSFDVVAYDAPSHGRSDVGPLGRGSDVIDIVEALALAPVVAMGHSMGAAAVSDAIVLRPDLFRAAVLEDPAWMSDELRAEIGEMIRNVLSGGAEIDIAAMDPGPTDPIDRVDWLESKQQFRPGPDGPDMSSVFADPWQHNVRRFNCPVLLIWGTSGLVSAEAVEEARAIFPQLRDVQLDAGHNIRREDYEGYLAAVRPFLESAPATASGSLPPR